MSKKAVLSVVELLDSVPRDSTVSSERNRERSHKLFIEFLGMRAHERIMCYYCEPQGVSE